MQIVRIEAEAKVQWKCFREEGQWIGVCDPLGLTAVGETHSDMVESIEDMTTHLLRDLVKRGEFEQFLRARNWSQVGMQPQLSPDQVMFDLPIDIVQQGASEALH